MKSVSTQKIVKAHDTGGLQSPVAFNFTDLRDRCDEHVEKVRQQTKTLIEQAAAEADAIRKSAHGEAVEAGRREGMRQAEEEIERRAHARADELATQKLNTILPAIQQAAERLSAEQDRWLTQWEAIGVRVSIEIAEKVIKRKLAAEPNIAIDMISEALSLAAGHPHIEMRLNPQDIELLGAQAEDVVGSMTSSTNAEIVSDESIERGGCIIRTQHGRIDAQVHDLLERIADELVESSIS